MKKTVKRDKWQVKRGFDGSGFSPPIDGTEVIGFIRPSLVTSHSSL
jgi:hypothetical protein